MINLYSDTQTKPTPAMRKAMADAEVGDEQRGLDPTVNRLCEQVAELTGKQAAVFLPSGTFCNEIAIMVHCQKGDEVICHPSAHIVNHEAGAPAILSGVMIRTIDGASGQFDLPQFKAALRPKNRYMPASRLVSFEQTSNGGGGSVWPLEKLQTIADYAHAQGLKVHMDGARLLNASIASGVSVQQFAQPTDSVWIDLSKGLGCPVGAVLAGSRDFIEQAWRWKQGLGGAMRQAGIIAAAGLYALQHHVERLAEDHANARHFAASLAQIPGLSVDPAGIETNIVFFSLTTAKAKDVSLALAERGVDIGVAGENRLRAVTHLDVGRKEIDHAVEVLAGIMADFSR